MEANKKVVGCAGNLHLCHIAEAYLRYFANGKVIVAYPYHHSSAIHPRVAEALLEDGIQWEEVSSEAITIATHPDFLLIFGEEEDPDSLPEEATTFRFTFELSESCLQNSCSSSELEKKREAVKRAVLKFIGKEF